MSSESLTITTPDDWHLHLRDADSLAITVPHTARAFARAMIMPNLQPPVATVAAALDYRQRIIAAVPPGLDFQPLMTLYLTDTMSLEEVSAAHANAAVAAVKYYPAGATTNSDNGVTDIEKVYPVLERMAELGLPLLIHGEVTDAKVDIFDREQRFIDEVLQPLLLRLPKLKLVLEHITTSQAVDFVLAQPDNVAATITIHHLLYNRNHLLAGGVRPHLYCLPILKRDTHQQALIAAACSSNPKFFLGTDSAPHAKPTKEAACGCAGVYSAPAALELYTEFFEQHNALDKLEAFASFHGADFYGLPRNQTRVSLMKEDWQMPSDYPYIDDSIVPIRAGEIVQWQLIEEGEKSA